MKYHKFFYTTEPEAQAFVESIQGDFQYVILPCFDEEGNANGYMVDVCGRQWTASMTNEVRPNTHNHWFAGMEQDYFNSIQ